MGKKYDAYEKAAQAESQSLGRLMDAEVGGDGAAVQQAAADLRNANGIASATWDEFMEDPNG